MQLPIYQVLECSTAPQALHPDQPLPQDQPPEYQEITDFPSSVKTLAINVTNPAILVQKNEYSEIPSAGTNVWRLLVSVKPNKHRDDLYSKLAYMNVL